MMSAPTIDELFERRLMYPDIDARERFARLVGLESQQRRLQKLLRVLVNPAGVRNWAETHHPGADELLSIVLRRPPLVVLAGDVGSGKTELAEAIGDPVARAEKIDITLLPLSLSARGQGRVGEMTQLLSSAFELALAEAEKLRAPSRSRGAIILLVDEADALAQSRATAQMHHEDRAGVNAFIRGIDRVASSGSPLAIIMCTNRINAIDPAVRRRAAEVLEFGRPNEAQRREVLGNALTDFRFSDAEIAALVVATGPARGRDYGFTYSDLTQRLLPSLVLDAYPDRPIAAERAITIAREMTPTPPFREMS